MLDVQNLAKSYGGRKLFANASLRLGRGDRVGLVGPNGAGKTTLLRIFVGEEHADDGTCTREKDLRVGYLPQEVLRTPDTTVLAHVLSARDDLLALAAEIAAAESRLSAASAHDAAAAAVVHQELLERYEALEGWALERRAREILTGLGFGERDLHTPLAALSGGLGMRVELARLLLARPQVLLLDEPTNHLDLMSLAWLEQFLAGYPGAWLVVSHDRYFLNRMVTSIAELTEDGLLVFDGNYDDYLEARAELGERLAAARAAADKRIQELQAFVTRFRAKATKARQAQSKAKLIEKIAREADAAPPPPPQRSRHLHIELPVPPRSGDTVFTLRGVRQSYGERVVYPALDLTLRRAERVALVGDNGAGKSTLLKILAGVLPIDAGERRLGHNVQVYYFAQHQTEALDPSKTVLEEMRALLPLETETRVRGLLGAFLFSGDDVDKRVAVLSGGEKSRLALAKMLARPANLLLLDEPTNHLDLDAREVVEMALADFGGTICFISHDRYFINRVATKVIEVRAGGRLSEYPGDYDYFLWKSTQEGAINDAAAGGAATAAGTTPAATAGTPPRTKAAAGDPPNPRATEREARKQAQREASRRAKEVARIEAAIEAAETRLEQIDEALCDPAVHGDGERLRQLTLERATVAAELPLLYAEWERVAG